MELRHSVRSIDRSKYLKHEIENKKIILKFPYDPKRISSLHDYTSNSAGQFEWNNTSKQWECDLTEGNIVKILELFQNDDLKIDDSLVPIISDVMQTSEKDLPSLVLKEGELKFTNCHKSVKEYFQNINFDKNDIENLEHWTSQAASLGVRIDSTILDELHEKYHDPHVVNIIASRKYTMPSNNQVDGPWFNSLRSANHALKKYPWVLYLSFWSEKTNWSHFENMTRYDNKDKNAFKVSREFADLLNELKDPIIIVDSIIGRDAIRQYIESNSLKVVYISDIDQP